MKIVSKFEAYIYIIFLTIEKGKMNLLSVVNCKTVIFWLILANFERTGDLLFGRGKNRHTI